MTDLISDYAEHLRGLDRAKSTIDGYIEVLRLADRELPAGLAIACADELRDWIFADHRGRTTRSHYRVILGGFFAWATNPNRPRLDYDPVRELPRIRRLRGRPRPVSKAELDDILQRARRPYRDWFLIAALTGARCMEIAALDREHIGQATTVLHGKGGKVRDVPTHPALWALAQQLPPGPVACELDGGRLSRQQVSHRGNHQLRSVLEHPGVSMHRLRHTFGTAAYRACKDLRAVQKLLGHESVATTETYVDVAEQVMQQAVLGLDIAA